MSICVAFNLSDGVVIAVDSATTMTDASGAITRVFLDADKIFQLGNLKVGIATYGNAALDGRTIGSFVREFSVRKSNEDLDKLRLAWLLAGFRQVLFSPSCGKYRSRCTLSRIPQNNGLPLGTLPLSGSLPLFRSLGI